MLNCWNEERKRSSVGIWDTFTGTTDTQLWQSGDAMAGRSIFGKAPRGHVAKTIGFQGASQTIHTVHTGIGQ